MFPPDPLEAKGRPNTVVMHPDFRMLVLANRPGFPFLGNDFFGALGTHARTTFTSCCRAAISNLFNEKVLFLKSIITIQREREEIRRYYITKAKKKVSKYHYKKDEYCFLNRWHLQLPCRGQSKAPGRAGYVKTVWPQRPRCYSAEACGRLWRAAIHGWPGHHHIPLFHSRGGQHCQTPAGKKMTAYTYHTLQLINTLVLLFLRFSLRLFLFNNS